MALLLNTKWDAFVGWLHEFNKTRSFKFVVILLICIAILLIVRLSVKTVRRIVENHNGGVTTDAERRAATLGTV